MGKQNMTLEDILKEYSPEPAEKQKKTAEPVKKEIKTERTASPDISDITDKQQYRDAFAQASERREAGVQPHYASRRPPMELNRTKVSFIQSTAMEIDSMPMRVNLPSANAAEPKEQRQTEIPVNDTPKIRRMSDSTRAKEMAKRKKHKNRSGEDVESYTYEKERPEGEYLYTQIHGAKKARTRKKVSHSDITAVGTETLHLNAHDVLSVTQKVYTEPVQPQDVEPAPRAEKTSIDLSSGSLQDADSLDVEISYTPEEAEEETRRRQMMSDKMELESAFDIRSDIAELRNSISFRVMALTLVLLISGYLSFGEILAVDWIMNLSAGMQAAIQMMLGVSASVVCFPVLKNGFHRLFTFRADTDSLAALSLTGCLAASVAALFNPAAIEGGVLLYMPCSILVLLLHSVGKLLIISREETNLRLATRRFNCYGLTVVENEQRAEGMARGVLGDFPVLATMRHTDSLADFRKYTYSADLADHFCRTAAPICFLVALAASIFLTVLREESAAYGLMVFSMFASACGCAAITFVTNLPMYKATKRMVRNGAVMLGYQSVHDFYDVNSMMVDASSMFPDGSVKLAGLKMYSNIKPEETLLAAASLSRHAGSVFSGIFKEVLAGKEHNLYPVENYVYEDSMGLCGWINNQRVLLGNRELMQRHNIEGMPSRNKEAELLGSGKEAVYLSVSGNLSAMFIVELSADKQVKHWAKQAVRSNMCLILHSVDAMITLHRISALFDIPQEMIKIIPAKMRDEYREETAPVENMSASMACNGTFSSMAQLIIAAKNIRSVATYGVVIQAVSLLLGIGIVLMEEVLHVGLTPVWLMGLQLVVAVVTLVSVSLRRII